jgi:maltooligosyltrehalose trehalohydrolase
VHAALTGEQSGYYADFTGGAEMIADSLREPFVYAMRYAPSRQRRHGAPSTGVPRDRFVVAIQNHDQVGNRAAGDRLSTLVSPEQLRLAAALLLLSPYLPLLFMGEEYGETNPFQYFISHDDPQLVEAVRDGRREEFAAFGWGDAVPDPHAESTFASSKLDRSKLDDPRYAGMVELYRDLIAFRKRCAVRGARSANGETGTQVAFRDGVITLERRTGDGQRVLAVFNCSERQQEVPLPEASWQVVLATDDAKYHTAVDAEVPAAVGAAGGSPGARRRLSGDEWKTEASRAPRTAHLGPWTAAVFTSEER